MDEETKKYDVESVIEDFGYMTADEVWTETCEGIDLIAERVYWRSVYFEAIRRINSLCITSVPRGKEFVQMCVEFAEPFSN